MAYFSNGTEGMKLEAQCDECLHHHPDAGCPIYLAHMMFNYDQVQQGQEKLRECLNILVDKDGICQMKKQIEAYWRTEDKQENDQTITGDPAKIFQDMKAFIAKAG